MIHCFLLYCKRNERTVHYTTCPSIDQSSAMDGKAVQRNILCTESKGDFLFDVEATGGTRFFVLQIAVSCEPRAGSCDL